MCQLDYFKLAPDLNACGAKAQAHNPLRFTGRFDSVLLNIKRNQMAQNQASRHQFLHEHKCLRDADSANPRAAE
jgi:hypothetical protein